MSKRFGLTLLLITFTSDVHAGDWPQILGPNRDGIAEDESLTTWPDEGPNVGWKIDVGEGFAGVAVRNDVLVMFHRKGDKEIVEARRADSGNEIWRADFDCSYESGFSSDAGPRCVPLISTDRVFVFGVAGGLRCLDLKSGKIIWNRDTWNDFGAPEGYFGAGSAPVLYKDRLIVNVGSRDNAAVVAFASRDGETLWQNVKDTASYSAPIVAKIGDVDHLIVVTRLNTVSLNPNDGSIRFQFPFGARGPTVNAATPVVMNNHVFVSASYNVGSVWAKVSATDVQRSGVSKDLLATQYATPVRLGNELFAVDGRQDAGPGSASLKCIDPAAQKVLWEEDGFDYGTLIRVKNEFIMLTCEGDLIRFSADVAKYKETHRSRVLESTSRGYRLPALSNGRLFVRDDNELKCLIVGQTK